MSFPEHSGAQPVADALTHDVTTAESWMDLLVADDQWVRREFEDIVAAAWGGSGPPYPRTPLGSHQPRRRRPWNRPQHVGHVRRAHAHHALTIVHVRGPPVRRAATA